METKCSFSFSLFVLEFTPKNFAEYMKFRVQLRFLSEFHRMIFCFIAKIYVLIRSCFVFAFCYYMYVFSVYFVFYKFWC